MGSQGSIRQGELGKEKELSPKWNGLFFDLHIKAGAAQKLVQGANQSTPFALHSLSRLG